MDTKGVLGNNDIDDVRWLCSLTESELDLLMGLKNLVKMRAKKIGRENLAMKFDLHMLRTFSFIFMEHLKGQLKDGTVGSKFDCNLLKQNLSGSFEKMSIEDLCEYICSDQRKKIIDRHRELREKLYRGKILAYPCGYSPQIVEIVSQRQYFQNITYGA